MNSQGVSGLLTRYTEDDKDDMSKRIKQTLLGNNFLKMKLPSVDVVVRENARIRETVAKANLSKEDVIKIVAKINVEIDVD